MYFFIFLITIFSINLNDKKGFLETSKKHHIFLGSKNQKTARGMKENHRMDGNHNKKTVLKFISVNNNTYYIESIFKKYLCAKPNDPGVIFCDSKDDENTQWKFERNESKNFRIKTDNKCLRIMKFDKRKNSLGFYLNVQPCENDDFSWNIYIIVDKNMRKKSCDSTESFSSSDFDEEDRNNIIFFDPNKCPNPYDFIDDDFSPEKHCPGRSI